MIREMRRSGQQLPLDDCIAIMKAGTSGVLALMGDEPYPYALPMSYVYDEGRIFFHSAKTGHKIDALRKKNEVSFCVIDQDEVIPETYTTHFRSAIAFGRIRFLQDHTERMLALQKLALKYAPDDTEENRSHEIEKSWDSVCVLEMIVEHLTGKQAIELVRKKQENA
ncbi:MAG: pyridoxamine 5'-phosphate oxidase family protein [Lachnospiraceae bacterium]|jgi:nitroimidazol reductase NimA-like FMN-containing flavoprotein (pyridoxamine 5'-phosphate oxidase superfamily)|nr:pyridoxamine 5'-phosphate oxidase family protein [Lachnospiraceae bacterium]